MISAIPPRATPITPSNTAYLTAKFWNPVFESAITAASFDGATDVITITDLAWANGDQVICDNAGTTGLTKGMVYFVIGVTGDDLQLSKYFGGTAENLGATETTPPTLTRIATFTTQRTTGTIYVGTAGNIVALPSGHADTDDPTETEGGAVLFPNVQVGDFVMGVKKVFETTTASNLVLKYDLP
ncbi:MAG: hypothetical protein WC760_02915 [Bacteroidia bacterium]|jgi:hypothetical protein